MDSHSTEPFSTPTGDAPPVPLAGGYLCSPALLLHAKTLGPAPMAIAAAHAEHVLQSVAWAAAFDLIEPILVGDAGWLTTAMPRHGLSLANCRIVPAADEAEAARIAVALVAEGTAQILMKGHLHTDALMRAVLDPVTGLRRGDRLSHVFAMRWPGRARDLLITDAALNVAPDRKTTVQIVRHAIRVARALGIAHPRIAMLSASEVINLAMPSSVAAGDFVASFRDEAEASGCSIAGPLALDVALSAASASLKGLEHDAVAGRADILVVPNIETGNALFKALVHLLNATAAGLVLGATVPIVLTSRADPVEAKLASIALARIVTAMPPAPA